MMCLLKSFPVFSWVIYFLIFECGALKYIWATKLIRFGNWKHVLLVYDLFHSLTIDSLCACVCTNMFMCVHMYVCMCEHMCQGL